MTAAVIGDPQTLRLGMALPMEGDQRIVLLGGLNGEAAPTDEVGMLAYARMLGSSEIADLIQGCEPTGPVVTHSFPSNQRRHVERLRRFPLAWLPLGDAVCSFDPIYGQGMTSAALQAQALAACLDSAGRLDRSFSKAYFKAAARVVAVPWSIAVGGDFAYPGTVGKKPTGTELLNRYTAQVILAGQSDDAVVVRFNEVISFGPSAGVIALAAVHAPCDGRSSPGPSRPAPHRSHVPSEPLDGREQLTAHDPKEGARQFGEHPPAPSDEGSFKQAVLSRPVVDVIGGFSD